MSPPAAVSWEPGRLDVFALGDGVAFFHKFHGDWGPGGLVSLAARHLAQQHTALEAAGWTLQAVQDTT